MKTTLIKIIFLRSMIILFLEILLIMHLCAEGQTYSDKKIEDSRAQAKKVRQWDPSPYIEELKDPHRVWSVETNHLRWGIYLQDPEAGITIDLNGKIHTHDYIFTVTTNTNIDGLLYYIYVPPNASMRFDLKLFDEQGKEVSKTEIGKKFGMRINFSSEQIARMYLKDKIKQLYFSPYYAYDEAFDDVIDLPKLFKIEKPGNYKLRIAQRCFLQNTNLPGYKPGIFEEILSRGYRAFLATTDRRRSEVKRGGFEPFYFPPISVPVRVMPPVKDEKK